MSYKEIEKQNSSSGRLINIGGGITLIVIGASISYFSSQNGSKARLFYGLIIVGLIMVVKGLMPEPHSK